MGNEKGTGLNLSQSPEAIAVAQRSSTRYDVKRNAVAVTCALRETEPVGEQRPAELSEGIEGVLEDISRTGMAIILSHELHKGDEFEFTFDFEGQLQKRIGKIMWVRPSSAEGSYGTGVHFLKNNNQFPLNTHESQAHCIYKLHGSHEAKAEILSLSQAAIRFHGEENLSVGTMLEIVINPWVDREGGILDTSFLDVRKVTDHWHLWDIDRVAKVTRSDSAPEGGSHVDALFVANKKT